MLRAGGRDGVFEWKGSELLSLGDGGALFPSKHWEGVDRRIPWAPRRKMWVETEG